MSKIFIASNVTIVGDVKIGKCSSIWFNTTLRGDVAPIIIGEYTNIQDGCVLHVDRDTPCIIGDYVTVGHGAIIHGAKVGDNCLVGMGAIILSNAEIGENSIVAAGAVVKEGEKIPAGMLVAGVPARIVRELTEEEIPRLKDSAIHYFELAKKVLGK